MAERKDLARARGFPDPFALFRETAFDLDKVFLHPFGGLRWLPRLCTTLPEEFNWTSDIDVFERDNRLVVVGCGCDESRGCAGGRGFAPE